MFFSHIFVDLSLCLNICVCSIVENWAEKGKNCAIYKLCTNEIARSAKIKFFMKFFLQSFDFPKFYSFFVFQHSMMWVSQLSVNNGCLFIMNGGRKKEEKSKGVCTMYIIVCVYMNINSLDHQLNKNDNIILSLSNNELSNQ